MIICMGSSPEWHFWFCVQTKRTFENAMLTLFFFLLFSFIPVLSFTPSFMPANTLYLYISFFISVTVICTSSLDALTMQNPFFHSITCTVFSTRHHNCLLPQKEFMGNFEGGDGGQTSTKKNSLAILFGGLERTKKARLRIQRAIIQQSCSPEVHARQPWLWRTDDPVSLSFFL